MTAPAARSAGNSAGRGLILTLLAVVFGFFLLARGFDGSSDLADADDSQPSDAADDDSSDDDADDADTTDGDDADDAADPDDGTTGTTTTSTTTTTPPVTNPPAQVKVATVNGRGVAGLAGATADILAAQGYVTLAKNAASVPVNRSAIYYRPSYGDDAKAVATALSAPADVLTLAPTNVLTLIASSDNVADFHIFVVLGNDNLIPVSVS